MADQVVALLLIGGVLGAAINHACVGHRVTVAKRGARIAAGLAYKSAVAVEAAQRDLWVMDEGQR